MYYNKEFLNYNMLRKQGTGGRGSTYKYVTYPFDKYEIKVKLTDKNEFVGVEEVRISRDFLSNKQRISTRGSHDIEEFYRE